MPPKPLPIDDMLDAALAVFLRCGFRGSSMAAIAAEAGIARRTFFNRFASKEALFDAAVEHFWARMPVASWTVDGAIGDDPVEALGRIALSIVDFWSAPEAVDLTRLIVTEARWAPGLAQAYLDRGKLPALQGLISYLGALRDRDVMAIPDPDLAARQLVGMLNEPLLWFRVLGAADEHPPGRRRYVAAEAVRVFVAAYPILRKAS